MKPGGRAARRQEKGKQEGLLGAWKIRSIPSADRLLIRGARGRQAGRALPLDNGPAGRTVDSPVMPAFHSNQKAPFREGVSYFFSSSLSSQSR